MSNKSQIQGNNLDLNNILNAINELPEQEILTEELETQDTLLDNLESELEGKSVIDPSIYASTEYVDYEVGKVNSSVDTLEESINTLESSVGTLESSVEDAISKVINLTLPASWIDNGDGKFSQVITIEGLTSNMKVNLEPNMAILDQMENDGVKSLFIENSDGVATAICRGAALSVEVTVQATLEVVK